MQTYPTIKRGTAVEFSQNGLICFGICAKDGNLGGEIEVETTKGIVKTWHILAYGWTGWMPEEITQIWEKHNPTTTGDIAEFE
jgi:hypothetical protein